MQISIFFLKLNLAYVQWKLARLRLLYVNTTEFMQRNVSGNRHHSTKEQRFKSVVLPSTGCRAPVNTQLSLFRVITSQTALWKIVSSTRDIMGPQMGSHLFCLLCKCITCMHLLDCNDNSHGGRNLDRHELWSAARWCGVLYNNGYTVDCLSVYWHFIGIKIIFRWIYLICKCLKS